MFGTKSPSRKAPATDLLIVAHGQPSDCRAGEIAMSRLAAAVQTHLPGQQVRGATLAADGALEREVAQMREGALVFPMFMADGWFVKTELPRRLGRDGLRVAAPLGLSRQLPPLAADVVRSRINARNWTANRTHVLVAAHGSGRSPQPAKTALEFANSLGALLPGVQVTTGFIEEPPSIADAARDLPVSSICLPFFAADGSHVAEDVPDALTGVRFRGEMLQALGLHREIPSLIATEVGRHGKAGVAA